MGCTGSKEAPAPVENPFDRKPKGVDPARLKDFNAQQTGELSQHLSGFRRTQTTRATRQPLSSLFPTHSAPVKPAVDTLFKPSPPVGDVAGPLTNPALGVVAGSYASKGHIRKTMEDRVAAVPRLADVPWFADTGVDSAFFGVFDGHGGDEVSQYLRQHTCKEVYTALQDAGYVGLGGAPRVHPPTAAPGAPQPMPPPQRARGRTRGASFTSADSSAAVKAATQAGTGQVMRLRSLSRVLLTHQHVDIPGAITNVFRRMDGAILEQDFADSAGSTATIAFLYGDALVVANTGDSDAYLCREGRPVRLSVAHQAGEASERTRITNAGGSVLFMRGAYRVDGLLQVSRTLGVRALKGGHKGLIPDPHVAIVELCALDEFLVMGSDGLFEAFPSPHHLIKTIKEELRARGDVGEVVTAIVDEVTSKVKTTDNVSMQVVMFNQGGVVTHTAQACGVPPGFAAAAKPFLPAPAKVSRPPSVVEDADDHLAAAEAEAANRLGLTLSESPPGGGEEEEVVVVADGDGDDDPAAGAGGRVGVSVEDDAAAAVALDAAFAAEAAEMPTPMAAVRVENGGEEEPFDGGEEEGVGGVAAVAAAAAAAATGGLAAALQGSTVVVS